MIGTLARHNNTVNMDSFFVRCAYYNTPVTAGVGFKYTYGENMVLEVGNIGLNGLMLMRKTATTLMTSKFI